MSQVHQKETEGSSTHESIKCMCSCQKRWVWTAAPSLGKNRSSENLRSNDMVRRGKLEGAGKLEHHKYQTSVSAWCWTIWIKGVCSQIVESRHYYIIHFWFYHTHPSVTICSIIVVAFFLQLDWSQLVWWFVWNLPAAWASLNTSIQCWMLPRLRCHWDFWLHSLSGWKHGCWQVRNDYNVLSRRSWKGSRQK